MTQPVVGVLALQGDFEKHARRLEECGACAIPLKRAEQLGQVSGVILPGGESTTMLKLLDESLFAELSRVISEGLPTFATCAGLILLARGVINPHQRSLGLLDVDVERNAYGRQVDSFISPAVTLTLRGKELLQSALAKKEKPAALHANGHSYPVPAANPVAAFETDSVEGVFIRAPRITRLGDGVEVLAEEKGAAVLVRQENIVAATFHPELSPRSYAVHLLFLNQIQKR